MDFERIHVVADYWQPITQYFAGFIMVPRLYSPIHFSFSFESLKHLSNAEKQHVSYSMVE
jgi:hypothetical protein